MRLFAIGDLQMPGGDDKPMDVFGPQWDRHFFHISEQWLNLVGDEDVVLVPGDISWAMQLFGFPQVYPHSERSFDARSFLRSFSSIFGRYKYTSARPSLQRRGRMRSPLCPRI